MHKVTDDDLITNFCDEKVSITDDLDLAVSSFNDELKWVLDIVAPEKEKVTSMRKLPILYDEAFREQHCIMKKHEQIWEKYREDHQWKAYKVERNHYNCIVQSKKRNNIQSEVIKAKGDMKQLYSIMGQITGSAKSNLLPEGKSNVELAKEFTDFFLNKILTIRKQFEDISPYMRTTKDILILQKFAPMSEKEVKEIIISMKSRCCELDALPTSLLKRMIDVCLPSITKIVNISLEMGQFTYQWKVAIVRPLLKKLGLDLINKNYRPVSTLSFLSKVIERAMLKQFNQHCNNYGLLPDYQSAYRSNYSCETSLLKLTNDILWNMENKQVTALIMMDLSAAFDIIDHELLLEILHHRYGISDDALKWYNNYLRSRGFKVCVGNSYSKERPLTFSVQQGSCSGAMIFIAYIESLSDIILQPIQLAGFADNHSIRNKFKPDSD